MPVRLAVELLSDVISDVVISAPRLGEHRPRGASVKSRMSRLVPRMRRSAKRCAAKPGPIAAAVWVPALRSSAKSAAPRPGHASPRFSKSQVDALAAHDRVFAIGERRHAVKEQPRRAAPNHDVAVL